MQRKTYLNFTTPIGTFIYPRLDQPESYNKGALKFSTKIEMPRLEADAWIKRTGLDKIYESCVASAKKRYDELPRATRESNPFKPFPLYNVCFDETTEEETGDVRFSFACHAGGVTKAGKKWEKKIPVYNASKKKLEPVPPIGSGTTGRIAFEVDPAGWFEAATGCGISKYLKGAQIVNLVVFGEQSADDMGFGEEEGGYDGDGSEFEKSKSKSGDAFGYESEGEEAPFDDDDF